MLSSDATYDVPIDRGPIDPLMCLVGLGLLSLGTIMSFAASWPVSLDLVGTPYHFAFRHSIFAGLSVLAIFAGFMTSLRRLWAFRTPITLLLMTLLILVLVPGIGHAAGGARRWLNFKFFNVQGGELAKVAALFAWSSIWLKLRALPTRHSPSDWRGLVYRLRIELGTLLVMLVLLLVEPDFGTASLIAIVTWLILYLGNVPLKPLLTMVVGGAVAAGLLIFSSEYRMRRIFAFFDPWSHRLDEGYQISQSLIAIGHSGLSGSGLGGSVQKLHFLPAAHTDFIASIVAEELGLLGLLILSLGYLFWALASFRYRKVLHSVPLLQGMLLSIGVLFFVQAFFNLFVCVGLLPTKGLTLPLVSYGGSSMLVSGYLLGLSLNIAARARTR